MSIEKAMKNRFCLRAALIAFYITFFVPLSLIVLSPADAQEILPPSGMAEQQGTDGIVELEGRRLFTIRTKLGPFSRESRARSVIQKLDKLLDDPDFDLAKVSLNETDTTIDVIAGDIVITSITQADAELAGMDKLQLAEKYAERLREVLPELQAKRTMSGALEQVDVKKFGQKMIHTFLEPIALNLAALAIGSAIILGIGTLIKMSLTRYVQDSTTRYNARKIVTFAGYFVCFLFALVIFRDSLSHLALVIGAAAAGVAFALKEVIVSIAGWIAVTFGDFYKVGDRVKLAGIKGDVIDIGFARTTLMELGEWVQGDLYTGRVVRVSNSLIFNEPLYNYSRDFPFLWDEITVPLKYGSDYDLAINVLEQSVNDVCGDYVEEASEHWKHITRKYLVEHAQIEPMVTYSFNDNWVEFIVRYVVHYKRRRKTKFALYQQILKGIDDRKDKLSLASTTFDLVGAPVIDVRVAEQPSHNS